MKHGIFKRDAKNWEVYFEDQWRGTYPQKQIAQSHFNHIVRFWHEREVRHNEQPFPGNPSAGGGK